MIMDKDLEEKLKLEIQHICDSGANEIRLLEMFKNFYSKYLTVKKPCKTEFNLLGKSCKGSISLGTACGNCVKCRKEMLNYKIDLREEKVDLREEKIEFCKESYLPISIYGRNEK